MHYGECKNCGYVLEMHYEVFCPKCNTDVLEIKDNRVFDLFKVMYHMEANGYMSKDDFWKKYILSRYRVHNDMYIRMHIDWDHRENVELDEIEMYFKAMSEILGLENGDVVAMWISW
ncbi:MAG: hypothetical protein IJ880_03790 [Bacilli bacterium]|nr:hypothetical protein [Bacilli bacterium]MBR3119809.1 hypothetical protein [Oceanobacillus sp.]